MREAVALARRIELRLPEEPAAIVVGFRTQDAVSVFFGEDPVVHFNARGELRRGYFAGRLIKADQGRLAALTRRRTEQETQLVRCDLKFDETEALVDEIHRRLLRLRNAMDAGRCEVLRQVPQEDDVFTAVRAWLTFVDAPLRIASSPRI
jgi:hypothetical protein